MGVRSSRLAEFSERSPVQHNCAGIYSPLDKSKSEIRLLKLIVKRNKPDKTHKLHVKIDTFRLDSGNIPAYTALSYEWNPPNTPSTTNVLIINGKEKHVSSNLWLALFYLGKDTWFEGRYWVDALCINQEDVAERGHQVQLMRRIYREASFVYVWLGSKWTEEAGRKAASLIGEYQSRALEELLKCGALSHLRADENYKHHWKAIDSMFSQSYWNRSWIIQELVAARRAYLLADAGPKKYQPVCLNEMMLHIRPAMQGSSLSDWSTIWAKIRPSPEKVDEKGVRRRMGTYHSVEAISWTKYKDKSETHNDLLSLLTRFCGQLATDPRDKVYSLLGIAQPNSDNSIRADYTLNWTEVFRDAAIYVIQDRNDLEVLIYAGSSVTGLPSWVPNWLDQERQGTIRFSHNKICLYGSCCSPHTARTPLRTYRLGRLLPTVSADGSLLTISASLFNIKPCFKAASPDGRMKTWGIFAPPGELRDIMFATLTANFAIFDVSHPEQYDGVIFNFVCLWWQAMFHFYPDAERILSPIDLFNYIRSGEQQSLTEPQRELLQRALDEQFPFLIEVPPSVGSAILGRKYPETGRENPILGMKDLMMRSKAGTINLLAKGTVDRQAPVYIPRMCFWSSELGTLGSKHFLASIPLCRFPIILSNTEGNETGYKVATSARVAGLEHGWIQQDDGTSFGLPVQEIVLV